MEPLFFHKEPPIRCNRTPTSKQQEAQWLAERIAASNVTPEQVDGLSCIAPRPARSKSVDPETKLARKRHVVPKKVSADFARYEAEVSERNQFKAMADGL